MENFNIAELSGLSAEELVKNIAGKSLSINIFDQPLLVIDECGSFSDQVEFNKISWNQRIFKNHKIGNKLPRGKFFDNYRHLESKHNAQVLGKAILSDLKNSLQNRSTSKFIG